MGISTADSILNDVARVQRRDVPDLAAASRVLHTDTTPLPRRLYAINDDTKGAA